MAKRPIYKPDAHKERQIAVLAYCDPRSVRKYLRGEGDKLQGALRARIAAALEKLSGTPAASDPPAAA